MEIFIEIKLAILSFGPSTWAFVKTDSTLDAKMTMMRHKNLVPLPGWPVKRGSKTRNLLYYLFFG